MTSSIQVSEEISRLLGNDPICGGRVTNDTVQAIAALAMKAAEPLPQGDEPTSYADFQQRRGMLPDLMYALAPIRDAVVGFDDKLGDTKLYFTLDELREMADAIDTLTAIGSQSIEGERTGG
jgi:hypothetical protein